MRHAKAEDSAPSDFERRLAERGRSDATETGRWLAEQGLVPDAALVSAATRTQETYAGVADGAGWELAPDLDKGLYSAGVDAALDLIRLTPDSVGTLIVIGHNPTMGTLVQLLDNGEGADLGEAGMLGDYPTSSVAVFTFEGTWEYLGFGGASLENARINR